MSAYKSVDEYIARAPAFAQPILTHLRQLVHKECPEVEEALKWSMPAFLYRNKILFSMAAFKGYCRFIFWRPEMARIAKKKGGKADDDGAVLGKVTQLSDLPPDNVISEYIREARRLTDEAPRNPMRKKSAPKPELPVPPEFAAALAKNVAASTSFQSFSPSHRREYIEWIGEAKREETRHKRIHTALQWLAEGKPRNWKYMNARTS
jgi:uncharacterized protein YdeI (YjbR/CyaY-like superfamily)